MSVLSKSEQVNFINTDNDFGQEIESGVWIQGKKEGGKFNGFVATFYKSNAKQKILKYSTETDEQFKRIYTAMRRPTNKGAEYFGLVKVSQNKKYPIVNEKGIVIQTVKAICLKRCPTIGIKGTVE